MIKAPRGAVALSITRDPELDIISSNQIAIRVEVKIYNPLTENIRITDAHVTFLFRGPSIPVLYGQSCGVGQTGNVLVPAGSITHTYIACYFRPGSPPYEHLLVAACGSTNCQLTPQLLVSAMKNLEIVSIVYYYVIISTGEDETRWFP
jgi:hypothetical protein